MTRRRTWCFFVHPWWLAGTPTDDGLHWLCTSCGEQWGRS